MPLMVMTLIFNRIAPGTPLLQRPLAAGIVKAVHGPFLGPNTKRHLGYVESERACSDWFAGDAFSAADVQMSFPLDTAASTLIRRSSAFSSASMHVRPTSVPWTRAAPLIRCADPAVMRLL